MPIPVSHERESASSEILVLKGPNSGSDLMQVRGSTPQILARNAVKFLWGSEEIKSHMLSPRSKGVRASAVQRADFSPERKGQLKGSLVPYNFLIYNLAKFVIFQNCLLHRSLVLLSNLLIK